MLLVVMARRFRLPTHAFEVHYGNAMIFRIATNTTLASAVIQLTALILQTIKRIPVAVISGVNHFDFYSQV